MRTLLAIAVVAALAGCKSKRPPAAVEPPAAEPAAAAPNRDPYRNVTPAKMKQQVEDIQKKEEQRDDRVLEQAR